MEDISAQTLDASGLGTESGPDLAAVIRWHAGWAGVVGVATVALLFAGLWMQVACYALCVGMAPSLGYLIARNYDGPELRGATVMAWAVAGALAASLTGGLASPLAAWCLTPMIAAGLLGGPHRLAQGAAFSLMAVAATGLAQAVGLVGLQPTGGLGFGLGFVGLTTTAVGAAAALMVTRRHEAEALFSAVAPAPVTVASTAQSSDEARAILDAQPFLVLVIAGDGSVERAFGHAPHSVVSHTLRDQPLSQIVPETDRPQFDEALRDAFAGQPARFAFLQAGEEDIWLALDAARLGDGRLAATLRDISGERSRMHALETARSDAEALAVSKSRFLANMSHELRTPLNAIIGFSDIMRQKIFGELPGKYVEYAELIHEAGGHLLDLINDVLDMSKIEAARYELNRERLDAREAVSAALRLMRVQADEAGVQLRGVLPAQEIEVDADRRALKQIVLNLVSNALKFTPRGGLVTVSLNALAGAMELSVADTGIGISTPDLERLGRPFEQAGDATQQARGTGLGLSLVRAFAELHGGEMAIESRLGEGTAVTVRLPVLVSALPAPAATPDAQPVDERSGAQVIAFKPQR